jgi:hypothetical protein
MSIRSLFSILALTAAATAQTPVVDVDWTQLGAPTRTAITLQVVENPPLTRTSPIHHAAWQALEDLYTQKTRLALWYPYPRLAVAELKPPAAQETFWDFTQIDPIVEDFFAATRDRSSVFTMSTIPAWMFALADPGPIPVSPGEAMWNYEAGENLRDPSGQELADYFARVASWYTAGGFKDELGKRIGSSHHFNIAYWEVLNEPEYEHALSIETYTRLYDKISSSVHTVAPGTKFVGMSLAEPTRRPEAFEYFLNPANHAPGVQLDAISYHFYATSEPGESAEAQQYTFFAQADAFLNAVRYIESIRTRLSPQTETHVNEAGCISADDLGSGPDSMTRPPSAEYWNLCGALFAYLYAGLAEHGIDLVGASQLVGYPTQFPSVSLLDWKTGEPNARYRVLELLHENLGPGDRPVRTTLRTTAIHAAAYLSAKGRRKILLINKRNQAITVTVPGSIGGEQRQVDLTMGGRAALRRILATTEISVGPFGVSVINFPSEK